MKLGTYLSSLTMPELEELRSQLNLTDDEELIFEELRHGRSNVETAMNCGIATSTLSYKITNIKQKLMRLNCM